MSDPSEFRRNFLSYLHLKEIETVLKDLVTFIDRQVTVQNLTTVDKTNFPDELKRAFVLSTFELTGDLVYQPEGGGQPVKLDESSCRFAVAFSLDVAISFSGNMLGLPDNVTQDYIDNNRYDGDMQDATNEIFNLTNGGLEKVIRKELEMDVTCKLLGTEMIEELSLETLPDMGSDLDILYQNITIGDLQEGKIIQFMPETLGTFLSNFMGQTIAEEDVKEFIEKSGGISAGSDAVQKKDKEKVKRVMVVDDTYLVRQLISDHLREYGYVVSERADGVGAVKRAVLMSGSLDLMILDLRLPDVSGYKVLQEIRRNPRTQNVKVILCSSISDKADIIRGIKLGALDYIVKPFSRETILGKVVKAIGRPGV